MANEEEIIAKWLKKIAPSYNIRIMYEKFLHAYPYKGV